MQNYLTYTVALEDIISQLNIIKYAISIFNQITLGLSHHQKYICSTEITLIFSFYCLDLQYLIIDKNNQNYIIIFKTKLVTCELKSNKTGSFINKYHNIYLPMNKSLDDLDLNIF